MATDIMAVPDDITLVHAESGDWITVYIGGANVYEGHSIEPDVLLDLIGVYYAERRVSDPISGRFPAKLSEVQA